MSTNYVNTLITVAPDSTAETGTAPGSSKPSVASDQYEMIVADPYVHTSDDVIFARVARQSGLPKDEIPAAQEEYFRTGRACLRTSPLAKKYGWGIHANEEGRIALIAVDSDRYAKLLADDSVKKVPAMRSSRG